MTDTLEALVAEMLAGIGSSFDGEVTLSEEQARNIAAGVRSLQGEVERLRDDAHSFKNFHRVLCERFDYTHDEKDWRRDQVSLIEWIAKRRAEKAEATRPEAVVVKGLPWAQNGRAEYSMWANVDHIDRCYTIEPNSNVFEVETRVFLSEYGSDSLGLHPTFEAAKAAAQADYERRILSAIELKPVAGAIEAAVKRLHENLASFYAEVQSELSTQGERADMWEEIDVNVEDLRAVLAALAPNEVR